MVAPIATSTASWAIPISGWWSVNSWTSPPTTEIHAASAMQTRTSGISSTTRATAPRALGDDLPPRIGGADVSGSSGVFGSGDDDDALTASVRSARPPRAGPMRRRDGRRSATARRAGRRERSIRPPGPGPRRRRRSTPQASTTTGQPARSRRRRWARYGRGSRPVTTTTVVPGRIVRMMAAISCWNSDEGWDDSRASRSRTRSSWPGASDGGSIANRCSAPW